MDCNVSRATIPPQMTFVRALLRHFCLLHQQFIQHLCTGIGEAWRCAFNFLNQHGNVSFVYDIVHITVAFAWSIFIECICHCWSCNWLGWESPGRVPDMSRMSQLVLILMGTRPFCGTLTLLPPLSHVSRVCPWVWVITVIRDRITIIRDRITVISHVLTRVLKARIFVSRVLIF